MTHKRVAVGLILFAYLAQLVVVPVVLANPTGPAVVGGQATVSGLGTSHVTITQASQQAIINWQQFNIAPNEVTQFIQSNAQSIALNRIFDQNPSQIFGSLHANGTVILLNSNGILFGPNAQVNVGGLIASSLNLSNANFLAGHYLFQGTGVEGTVKNMGTIQGSHDGVYLLAPNVENSGVITSPGGNIVLAAGAKAFLSSRPDGRGFLAELSNPLGQSANLKDLIADGGMITMAGRVVNQTGLIRADSVREQNGKIELLASEAVTLQDGSRTLARGGDDGVSNGGTIRAIADLTSGTATFQKGALVDVSGGKNGGDGGFAEVSGAAVRLGGQFLGRTLSGFHGGRFLIDPTVSTSSVGPTDFLSFEGSGASEVTFQSPVGSDLVVTGQYDLLNWQLQGSTPGTLTFTAANNLRFTNFNLTNTGTTKWDYNGVAQQGDILFSNSTIASGNGGSMSFSAQGNIALINAAGQLSTIRTTAAGGDIHLNATTGDIVSASVFDSSGAFLRGIRLEGPGNLFLTAGRDFIGGKVAGIVTGPGFVLTNGTASVTAGRNVGGPTKGINQNDPDEYANFTLGKGTIDVTATTGNIYMGRVQDKGLSDRLNVVNQLMTVDPSNSVKLTAEKDIFLNPRIPPGASSRARAQAVYPASFSAESKTGRIVVEATDVNFWPSPTGRITLSAQTDIVGIPRTHSELDTNYVYIFVGTVQTGGQWKIVQRDQAFTDPSFSAYITSLTELNGQVNNPLLPPIPASLQLQAPRVDQIDSVPSIKILEADPSLFNNKKYLGDSLLGIQMNSRAASASTVPAVPVTVQTTTGDIKFLSLDFTSLPFAKKVSMTAGQDIAQVVASIGVPQGVEAVVSAGRNIDMGKPQGASSSFASGSGLNFIGTGTARVSTGGDLNLADSKGIIFRSLPVEFPPEHNKGGFLDLAVGHDLLMDQSRIHSVNGASISIHGRGTGALVDVNVGQVINGRPFAVVKENGVDVLKEVLFDGKSISLPFGDPNQTLSGPLTLHVTLIERNGALFLNNGERVQAVRVEGKPLIVKDENGTSMLVFVGGGQTFLAKASEVSTVAASGGIVKVGKNVVSAEGDTGIITFRGGAIEIKATGDIDVDKSRIATFGSRDQNNIPYRAGDINLVSTDGNISAGSGSRNDLTTFVVEEKDNTGRVLSSFRAEVPGSGVFSYHADDQKQGELLVFPRFDDPQIRALGNEIARQGFLGHDTSSLRKQQEQLLSERQPLFLQEVEQFIAPKQLGNISFYAQNKNIIVPEAGIRGRRIGLFAPNGDIDLRGGVIQGSVSIASKGITGDVKNSFIGAVVASVAVGGGFQGGTGSGGGGSLGGLSGTTGAVAAGSASATTAAVSTSAKSSESQETAAAEVASQNSQSRQLASNKDNEKDGKSQLAKSVRVKRGVVIQVDVKPEVKPAS